MKRSNSKVFAADDLREIQRLPVEEQEALLFSGEPGQRIRAAWSLGVAGADNLSSLVRRATAREPNPGVRRHFVVVLAGLGEVDIIAGLARSDSDDRVRATAAQYIGSFIEAHPALEHVASELLATDEWDVHAALLSGVPDEHLPAFRGALVASARSPSLRLREVAVRRLEELEDAVAIDALIDRARDESDTRLRRSLTVWLHDRLGLEGLQGVLDDGQYARALADLREAGVDEVPQKLRLVEPKRGELVEYGFLEKLTQRPD